MYTKDDVAQYRGVDGAQVPLSDAERQLLADEWNRADAELEPMRADLARRSQYDAAIKSDPTLAQFRAMTRAQFDAWWDANVTNAAQAIGVLKRLAWVVIRRCL